MRKKSKWLFALLLLLILFVSFRIFIYTHLYNKVENDAKAINELGIIRGSIQRLVKLELENRSNSDLEANIDNILNYYIEYNEDLETTKLTELKASWSQLKVLLKEYNSNPSEKGRLKVIQKSEECWELADSIVLRSQHESEKKLEHIRFLTTSFILDISIILAFSFISKRYVHDNLEVSVLFDPLTKAYNRRYFTEVINYEIEKAHRSRGTFSLIILDIDHFKQVNDIHGHSVGDYVLKEIVLVIKKNIRKYDILCRIGGEEFTIMLPNTEIKCSYNLAERLREIIEKYTFIDAHKITISLGLTQYENGDTLDTILKRADEALYTSKNSGRNRTSISSNVDNYHNS